MNDKKEITTQKEAHEYIDRRLDDVKEILDDIADKTGIIYFVLNLDTSKVIAKLGRELSQTMEQLGELRTERFAKANGYWERRKALSLEHPETMTDEEREFFGIKTGEGLKVK